MAITREAWHIGHQRVTAAREAIEQRGFSDVGAAN
jgi:hypothetical protein